MTDERLAGSDLYSELPHVMSCGVLSRTDAENSALPRCSSGNHIRAVHLSGRRRREWRHPSQNREDPRWLIGKMVVKQLESSRIIGKVMKW